MCLRTISVVLVAAHRLLSPDFLRCERAYASSAWANRLYTQKGSPCAPHEGHGLELEVS